MCPLVCLFVGKHVGVSFFRVSPQRLCVYMVVCINLYNFEFIQAFIYACAQLMFSRNRELESHRDASSITTFSLVDKEIRAKFEL